MHPVMSASGKVVYWVSEDRTTLSFDAGDAFGERRLKRPIRFYTAEERLELIHTYIESNLPDFNEQVECSILKMGRYGENEHFVVDGGRLKNFSLTLQVFIATMCLKSRIHGMKFVFWIRLSWENFPLSWRKTAISP